MSNRNGHGFVPLEFETLSVEVDWRRKASGKVLGAPPRSIRDALAGRKIAARCAASACEPQIRAPGPVALRMNRRTIGQSAGILAMTEFEPLFRDVLRSEQRGNPEVIRASVGLVPTNAHLVSV